jgi:hypothetical protein
MNGVLVYMYARVHVCIVHEYVLFNHQTQTTGLVQNLRYQWQSCLSRSSSIKCSAGLLLLPLLLLEPWPPGIYQHTTINHPPGVRTNSKPGRYLE